MDTFADISVIRVSEQFIVATELAPTNPATTDDSPEFKSKPVTCLYHRVCDKYVDARAFKILLCGSCATGKVNSPKRSTASPVRVRPPQRERLSEPTWPDWASPDLEPTRIALWKNRVRNDVYWPLNTATSRLAELKGKTNALRLFGDRFNDDLGRISNSFDEFSDEAWVAAAEIEAEHRLRRRWSSWELNRRVKTHNFKAKMRRRQDRWRECVNLPRIEARSVFRAERISLDALPIDIVRATRTRGCAYCGKETELRDRLNGLEEFCESCATRIKEGPRVRCARFATCNHHIEHYKKGDRYCRECLKTKGLDLPLLAETWHLAVVKHAKRCGMSAEDLVNTDKLQEPEIARARNYVISKLRATGGTLEPASGNLQRERKRQLARRRKPSEKTPFDEHRDGHMCEACGKSAVSTLGGICKNCANPDQRGGKNWEPAADISGVDEGRRSARADETLRSKHDKGRRSARADEPIERWWTEQRVTSQEVRDDQAQCRRECETCREFSACVPCRKYEECTDRTTAVPCYKCLRMMAADYEACPGCVNPLFTDEVSVDVCARDMWSHCVTRESVARVNWIKHRLRASSARIAATSGLRGMVTPAMTVFQAESDESLNARQAVARWRGEIGANTYDNFPLTQWQSERAWIGTVSRITQHKQLLDDHRALLDELSDAIDQTKQTYYIDRTQREKPSRANGLTRVYHNIVGAAMWYITRGHMPPAAAFFAERFNCSQRYASHQLETITNRFDLAKLDSTLPSPRPRRSEPTIEEIVLGVRFVAYWNGIEAPTPPIIAERYGLKLRRLYQVLGEMSSAQKFQGQKKMNL
jgi:hypothetical protein